MALAYAGALALHSAAHLHVIYVMDHFAAFAGFMLAGQPTYHTIFFDYANDESYMMDLQNAVKCVIPQNITAIIHILSGSRVQNIIDVLRESQADLCIIGLRKNTEWWENIFSPNWIKQIMRLAPCPVLSIPKSKSQISK